MSWDNSSEIEMFEIHLSKRQPGFSFEKEQGVFTDPKVQAAWEGWQLKDDVIQTQAAEASYKRRWSGPRVASPAESIFEAVRHVLKLAPEGSSGAYKDQNGISINMTNAWCRLEDAFQAIHPDLEVAFPSLMDFDNMRLNSKRAFDLIVSPKSQEKMSKSEVDRLLAVFEHGLIFSTVVPSERLHLVPISQSLDSVFIDGAGMVPLNYSEAQETQHNQHGVVLSFTYTNYRGETGKRKVIPVRIYQGQTEYHTTEQWLLEAWDLSKNDYRNFAIKDILSFNQE